MPNRERKSWRAFKPKHLVWDEWRALACELPMLEDRARRCGLLKTAVKINSAVQAVGWEIQERVTITVDETKKKNGKVKRG